MLKSTRIALFIAFLSRSLVFSAAVQSANAQEATSSLIATETFASVALRGYGTVSGVFRKTANGSVMEITCEDTGKAKLLQAKYLSDLCVLPGVKDNAEKGFMYYEIQGQGCISAYCDANKVTVLAAKSEQELTTLIAQVKPKGVTTAQMEVPIYLNRWDQYGWRFYYRNRPLQFPKGYDCATYNILKDFDDAEALDHSGFVFWNSGCQINDAEGIMMESLWDWGAQASNARKLPVALNSSNELGQSFPWLLNRYPEQLQQKMPQFVGNFHKVADPYLGGRGSASWNSNCLNDAGLGVLQQSVRRFMALPSLVSYSEPHQELAHGPWDVFFEYGPVADAGYRDYLRREYKSLDALSQRWFGVSQKIATWENIRVPELASFIGWNAGAVDLKGEWAVGYEELADKSLVITREKNDQLYYKCIKTKPAPLEWFGEKFDDSSWPKITAPGDDQAMFIQHRPAVFRRTFPLDAAHLSSSQKWWLYVWDLNDSFREPEKMMAFVNGKNVGESSYESPAHWAAFEVKSLLKPGSNQISLRLPKGYLGYRVYLSSDEPKQYPHLGEEKNAQWVDLVRWTNASRMEHVRRGMEMLRQVDPNRQITLMAPDHYADGVKALAEAYGGEFHNTGYMGVFYGDYLPGLMQGAKLPFSVELGEPAVDLAEFKKTMGLYLVENVQSVDYYDHVGKLLWNPAMRKDYEDNLKLYHLFGKYHSPDADIAVLFSTEVQALTQFPWGNDPNTNLMSGYHPWNISSPLRGYYNYDFLSESSFASGDAKNYRVIIDSNTSIIDENLLTGIEKWVRDGGIFITSGQTGRHTPTKLNEWPISRLSGYKVVRIDRHSPEGRPQEIHKLTLAPGQKVFSEQWTGVAANGLGLKKELPECRDWMLWDDGSTAIGARPLGKGMIIHVGVKFGGAKDLVQRIELSPASETLKRFRELYAQVLDAQNAKTASITVSDSLVFSRHYVSNNGLYDVWTVWNENNAPLATQLKFDKEMKAVSGIEVSTGTTVNVVPSGNGATLNVALDALQSKGFLTPRGQIEKAPREWFALQRNWWRGTTPAGDTKFPTVESLQKSTVDLTGDWAFNPLALDEDIKKFTPFAVDDAAWKRMRLGIWTVEYPGVERGVFRKKFHVPAAWISGPVSLWIKAWATATFSNQANVYLDGTLIQEKNSNGISGMKLESLKPGTEHVLVIEISGKNSLKGSLAEAWLTYLPNPVGKQSLQGLWMVTKDALHYDSLLTLPGAWSGWLAKRKVIVDSAQKNKNVLLHYSGDADLTGVIINGRWIRQDHHQIAKEWLINVTPWVKFGQENEIQIGRLNGPGSGTVKALSLDFYEPGTYP